MQRMFVLWVLLASCLFALQQKALTNDDIIKMVKGGLPDDVILLAIESQPSNFDTSPQALIELKQQGASNAVLNKIVDAAGHQHPAQPQVTPVASGASQVLSPADEQQVRTLVEHAASQSRQLLAQPMEQNLHELLDEGLSGLDLPLPSRAPFVALFAPYRQALHQVLEHEAPRLRQQLKKASGPRSNFKSSSPLLRPVAWARGTAPIGEAPPNHTVGSRERSASGPYRGLLLGSLNSQPACAEKSSSSSQSVGDVIETITISEWMDTPDAIGSGEQMEMVITANPEAPVQGTNAGKLSSSTTSRACVDRCPTADGRVAGKSEEGLDATVEVMAAGGTVTQGRKVLEEDVTAEGHVGDDARLRDVVLQADFTYEEPKSQMVRWQGTATFDPHGSESEVPLQVTNCSANQVAIPVAQCSGSAPTVSVSRLRDTYLQAERKWSFLGPEPGDFSTSGAEGSKCVIAKFSPPTRTVMGQPSQKTQLKAELITVKRNQPTKGIFQDLRQIAGDGDTQANGTRTSPEEPAQLTYTAPAKQWPCNDPPGFGVYRATSRAGVLDGGNMTAGYNYDDWTWFLAPGCLRLSIHERTEVQYMIVSMVSEVTFPMDLSVNENGQVEGEAAVPREARQTSPCVGMDRWSEQWHANGNLDTKSNTLALKLWFEASPREGSFACGAITIPHRAPGFRSDAYATPLDQFTLSDKEGAARHFVVSFYPSKHTIDVTLLPPQGGAAVK